MVRNNENNLYKPGFGNASVTNWRHFTVFGSKTLCYVCNEFCDRC